MYLCVVFFFSGRVEWILINLYGYWQRGPPSLNLNLIRRRRVVALDRHVRNAQLEVVGRPVLQLGDAIGVLVLDGKVGEQHARRVRGDEDQHVPDGVQIGEVDAPPRVTVELVDDPAGQSQREDDAAAVAQPQHATVALAVGVVRREEKVRSLR